MNLVLDRRPIIVAIAGPNGAGKTTFYSTYLQETGLSFINADKLARELEVDSYTAAQLADSLRREFVQQKTSFVFETVFSDPVGDKIAFLKASVEAGYAVILCFIGISGPDISDQRVAMRVSQGGHDVPLNKLIERFPRTMSNLKLAISVLPNVWVFDNDDLHKPFRVVAKFEFGQLAQLNKPLPKWLRPLLR